MSPTIDALDSEELAGLLASFNAALPLARASTIPSAWYTSQAVAARETSAVFSSSWQYAGRREQVERPGQFMTLSIAGEPVIVARDKAGELHAMANVCRHRAARVECREEGTAAGFRCRYHGWSYNLAGKLAGAPECDGVEDLRKDEVRLPRYQVDTWGPFVFVHLGSPRAPLADLLAPVAARSGATDFQKFKFGARRVYEMRCNWKIFCDNYLDGGYHITTLHPDLAKVVDMAGYHTIVDGDASLQLSPLKPTAGAKLDESLNSVRSGDAAHYWWVYPNFMLNIYGATMDTNVVLPLGPDRCVCIFDFFFATTGAASTQAFMDQSLAVAHQVQLEDQEICEEVQRGLSSRAYDTGRFSVRREAGGYHFHQLLAKALRAGQG